MAEDHSTTFLLSLADNAEVSSAMQDIIGQIYTSIPNMISIKYVDLQTIPARKRHQNHELPSGS